MHYLIIALEGAVATVVAHVLVRRFLPTYSLPDSITLKSRHDRSALALLVGIMAAVWFGLHYALRIIVY